MSEGKTLLIVRKPPYGSVDSWEAMRLALSFYGERASVALLFEGNGVSNWVTGMVPDSTNSHSVLRFVSDLEKFAVPVYIVREDLTERGFAIGDLASPHAKLIPRSELAKLLASYDCVAAM